MKTFKDIPFELDNGCVKGQLIFENNFGVSILMGPFTKGGLVGKYELTILQWIPEKSRGSFIDFLNNTSHLVFITFHKCD